MTEHRQSTDERRQPRADREATRERLLREAEELIASARRHLEKADYWDRVARERGE